MAININKFAYHQQTNRNGTTLCNFLKEQNLLPVNTYFQKRDGQRWTYTAPNGAKAQLDFLIINKKWKNSAKDCRAFNSFEGVKSDHRVVSAKIRLTLRANKPKSSRYPPYDRSSLRTNPVITNTFTIQLRNRFNALQQEEIGSSPNNTYNNFISACEDASKETIPLKKKTKKRVPWDSEEIVSKRKILHRMAEIKNSEPKEINISNFNSARDNLSATYESEQKKYIQNKIDEITNTTTNRKSSEAWKAVNEIYRRKTTNKAKLKAKTETERVNLWKEHFQKLPGLQPTLENVNVTPIIDNDLGIRVGALQ